MVVDGGWMADMLGVGVFVGDEEGVRWERKKERKKEK